MASLSNTDVAQLRKRGIEIEEDVHGTRYVFSLQGLFWLFNLLQEKPTQGKKLRLTADLLKELARVSISENWRTLRIKASELPAYADKYFQLATYLNGSPPRMLENTGALRGLGGPVSIFTLSNHIAPVENTDAIWLPTEREQEQLSAGGYLEFGEGLVG
ncbi:hypothetical protein D3C76_1329250 [compost metagenome]